MKTVIEMAREAGLHRQQHNLMSNPVQHRFSYNGYEENLERFAELARADQDEKYKWDIHSCGPTCKRYACVAIREAVEAEREACAKVVEASPSYDWHKFACEAASAIRARSNT